jgi:hypothetical protein
MCSAELHLCAYGCIIYVKESIHPVVVVNKIFKRLHCRLYYYIFVLTFRRRRADRFI